MNNSERYRQRRDYSGESIPDLRDLRSVAYWVDQAMAVVMFLGVAGGFMLALRFVMLLLGVE